MALVRELAEVGRRIRVDAGRRQRLPCAQGWIVAGPDLEEFHGILAEELNVEAINVEQDLDRFQRIELAPNFRALAPKARADVNAIANEIKSSKDPEALLASIQAGDCEIMGVHIELSDVELRRVEKEGFAASTVQVGTGEDAAQISLVLDMNDAPELLSKGLARDITRRIQAMRKTLNLEIEATIDLEIWMKDAPQLFPDDEQWIVNETRAAGVIFHPVNASPPEQRESFEVDGTTVWFTVT
jgi:isoleucyl-tRNA synthetase